MPRPSLRRFTGTITYLSDQGPHVEIGITPIDEDIATAPARPIRLLHGPFVMFLKAMGLECPFDVVGLLVDYDDQTQRIRAHAPDATGLITMEQQHEDAERRRREFDAEATRTGAADENFIRQGLVEKLKEIEEQQQRAKGVIH